MNRKHDLKYEFMQLFMIYLDIGNEDVFKILHLVSEDFDNVDSRTHLFNAFEKYFEAQGQDCHEKGTLHSVNCGELRGSVTCHGDITPSSKNSAVTHPKSFSTASNRCIIIHLEIFSRL